ncbi:MAG: hypothetical protein RLZZ09_1835 [Pseudomonadota bacterium]|jgi:hypothetical protein
MSTHPELRPGEVYVGNAPWIAEHYSGLKTIRLGEVAYDYRGNPMSNGSKPVFVGKDDIKQYREIQQQMSDEYSRMQKERGILKGSFDDETDEFGPGTYLEGSPTHFVSLAVMQVLREAYPPLIGQVDDAHVIKCFLYDVLGQFNHQPVRDWLIDDGSYPPFQKADVSSFK